MRSTRPLYLLFAGTLFLLLAFGACSFPFEDFTPCASGQDPTTDGCAAPDGTSTTSDPTGSVGGSETTDVAGAGGIMNAGGQGGSAGATGTTSTSGGSAGSGASSCADKGMKTCQDVCVPLDDPATGCAEADTCSPCPVQAHQVPSCAPDGACDAMCKPGWSDCDSNPENGCETQGDCPTVSCGPVQLSPAGGWSVCVEYDNASLTVGLYGGVSYNQGSLVNPAPPVTANCLGTQAASGNNSTKPQVYCLLSAALSGNTYDIYLDMRSGGAHVNDVCTPGNVGSPTCPVVVEVYEGVILKGAYDPALPQAPFAIVQGNAPTDSVQLEVELP